MGFSREGNCMDALEENGLWKMRTIQDEKWNFRKSDI